MKTNTKTRPKKSMLILLNGRIQCPHPNRFDEPFKIFLLIYGTGIDNIQSWKVKSRTNFYIILLLLFLNISILPQIFFHILILPRLTKIKIHIKIKKYPSDTVPKLSSRSCTVAKYGLWIYNWESFSTLIIEEFPNSKYMLEKELKE